MSGKPQNDDSLSQLRRLAHDSASYQLQSDAELLELYVQSGNRAAIETLIVRYAPLVASVCSLTVADPTSAEDAFQATFLVLLQSGKSIRRKSSVAAWLHGVAYRCACRARKKHRLTLFRQSGDDVQQICEPNTDPVALVARQMELEALDRELEKLPERLRAPLVEHYLLGFSAPQIAERMQLSLSAVEGRLRRGRRVLRTQLARRGISLSVLLVASGIIQQHLAASTASQWTLKLMETHLVSDAPPFFEVKHLTNSTSHVSTLVNGEIGMFGTGTIKGALIAGAVLIVGGLAAVSSDMLVVRAGDSPTNRAAASSSLSLVAPQNVSQPMTVQFTPPTSPNRFTPAPSASTPAARNPTLPAPMSDAASVEWQRPEADEGLEPSWLAGGRSATAAIEKNRAVLSQKLEFDFNQQPLLQVIDWLSDQTGTQFELNIREIEELGIATADTPVTISGTASVREILRRIGEPLELTYVVTESTVEITTKDDAIERTNLRFYDLSYVLPNSENTEPLVKAIQSSIDPDFWQQAEGRIAIVGSMMIVSAPDTTHQGIELLLLNISKMHPQNAVRNPVSGIHSPSGGMGGMGSGMGGGMF